MPLFDIQSLNSKLSFYITVVKSRILLEMNFLDRTVEGIHDKKLVSIP